MANKLSHKQISVGYEVLAEFLGYQVKDYWWHHPAPDHELAYSCIPNSLNSVICKFDTSYDWLIVVWHKFRNLTSGNELMSIQLEEVKESIIESIRTGYEIDLFKTLVEACIWYMGALNIVETFK